MKEVDIISSHVIEHSQYYIVHVMTYEIWLPREILCARMHGNVYQLSTFLLEFATKRGTYIPGKKYVNYENILLRISNK